MNSLNLCLNERPTSFDQMVGQYEIVENIRNQSINNSFFQCYILEGQFGSGKTTMARILAHTINCKNRDEHGNPCGTCQSCRTKNSMDIIELDAASNSGVDDIRGLKESVSYMPSELEKKIYIIDEVHKLSDGAFNALLKVIEEPPEHVVFILCTTEMRKIPDTIRSRAAKYHFNKIKQCDILTYLKDICKRYGLEYNEDGIDLITKQSEGSMRNALKLLEQIAQSGVITLESVNKMLGLSNPEDLFYLASYLLERNSVEAIAVYKKLSDKGINNVSLVRDLLDIFSDCVVASVAGVDSISNTELYLQLLKKIVVKGNSTLFCSTTNSLMELSEKLLKSNDDTTFICGIIQMSVSENAIIEQLERRIKILEDQMTNISKNDSNQMIEEEDTVLEEPMVLDLAGSSNASFEEPIAEIVPKDEVKQGQEEDQEEPVKQDVTSDLVNEDKEQNSIEDSVIDKTEDISEEETLSCNELDELDTFQLFSMFSVTNNKSSLQDDITESCLARDDNLIRSEVILEQEEKSFDADIEEFLLDLYDNDIVAENLFSLCLTRSIENNVTVFSTSEQSFYRMAVAYRNRGNGFPFTIRLVQKSN